MKPLLPALPLEFAMTRRLLGVPMTREVLLVDVPRQQMAWFCMPPPAGRDHMFSDCGQMASPLNPAPLFLRKVFRVSTSRFGVGEKVNSNRTPRGLHRIARKAGAGWPIGSAFESRRFVGFTWAGCPGAPITNRILWLEGLEPGRNRGGDVDTFARYVYIHGTGDEPSLGRPASRGCIHLAGADLFPLFDAIAPNTLVWIDGGSTADCTRDRGCPQPQRVEASTAQGN